MSAGNIGSSEPEELFSCLEIVLKSLNLVTWSVTVLTDLTLIQSVSAQLHHNNSDTSDDDDDDDDNQNECHSRYDTVKQ